MIEEVVCPPGDHTYVYGPAPDVMFALRVTDCPAQDTPSFDVMLADRVPELICTCAEPEHPDAVIALTV